MTACESAEKKSHQWWLKLGNKQSVEIKKFWVEFSRNGSNIIGHKPTNKFLKIGIFSQNLVYYISLFYITVQSNDLTIWNSWYQRSVNKFTDNDLLNTSIQISCKLVKFWMYQLLPFSITLFPSPVFLFSILYIVWQIPVFLSYYFP